MDQERINRYWSRRAEDFSGLRMKDYGGILRENYRNVLAEYLPATKGGRALDLGTGAGFFSFILSELGWSVTAVDYSGGMLEKAKKNASELGFQNIEYLQMNAQELSFPNEAFDAVVSRNVTWTLPDPAKAYAEVVRVLKPGGKFVNFDANYGRAFQAAEARGEKPTHPTQTLEQLLERNEIAKSLYVCKEKRPFWDMEVLAKLGIRYFTLDLDIDRRICAGSTKEEIYAGLSKNDGEPLFMLCAEK